MLKPIPGYEDRYSITDCGDVYSQYSDIFLKQSYAGAGYKIIFFYTNGKNKGLYIHRLVASAFVNNPLSKPEVNHIDGDKENNHFSNLEWVTKKENAAHAIKSGLRSASAPEANLFKKGQNKVRGMSDHEVREIRELRNYGYQIVEIAKIYSISSRHAGRIANGKAYKDIL